MFSITADNLPLLGPIPGMTGLWAAEAIWVTHAAGAAQLLARQMTGSLTEGDPVALHTLRPERFAHHTDSTLEQHTLRLYHDIYASADNA